MKRGKVDKQGESVVASYRYLGVSNPGLQMIWSNECDVSCLYGTRASFQYIRRIPALHSIILRPKNPLDKCTTRLQPLVYQYKPEQHQTFAIEKFRDLIVTTRSCPGDEKNLFNHFCTYITKQDFLKKGKI